MAVRIKIWMRSLGWLELVPFVHAVPWVFDGRAWGHAQDLNLAEDACKIFASVPGWLQTVQRAEHWGHFSWRLCWRILALTIRMSAIM